MISVFVMDDNEMMRKMLRQLVETEEDCKVTGEAGSMEDAVENLKHKNYDVILADISLQGREGGIQMIRKIRGMGIQTPVLSVSLHEQALYENLLRDAGAQGYLMKQDAVENLVPAIRELKAGGHHWAASAQQS
jgi:DNA-binding NarL/FixJ family response regulator